MNHPLSGTTKSYATGVVRSRLRSVLALVTFALLTPSAATAAPIALALLDDLGHSSGAIIDGDSTDIDPSDGVVSFSGVVGDWSVMASGALAPGSMTLASVQASASTTSTLFVLLTSVDQAWPAGFALSFTTALQNATAAYGVFGDPTNLGFSQAVGLAAIGPFSAGTPLQVFSGSTTAAAGFSAPHSLTQLFVITGNGGETTLVSGQADLTSVPEPATALLLGASVGLGLLDRRRRSRR
jgi:hypothetical protein